MAKQKTKSVSENLAPGTAIVKAEFRDINNFEKVYAKGEDVTGVFEDERLANLVQYGLVEVAVSELDIVPGNDTGSAENDEA